MYIKAAGGEVNLAEEYEANLLMFSLDRLHRIMIILGDLANNMKSSLNPKLDFEIAMAKIANPKSSLTLEDLAERISNLEIVATSGDLNKATIIEDVPMPNFPESNKEIDYAKTRVQLKDEAKVDDSVAEQNGQDLSNDQTLQKL